LWPATSLAPGFAPANTRPYLCAVQIASYLTPEALTTFIRTALAEDVGDGDHSALAAIPADAQNRAHLLVKGEGILAGIALAPLIFNEVDPALRLNVLLTDGTPVKHGDIAFTVEGPARSILTAERLVLNCMQRMSGIATYTAHLTGLLAGTKARLLDTRKTTPNFRICEKWAVLIRGGRKPPLRLVRHDYPEGQPCGLRWRYCPGHCGYPCLPAENRPAAAD
jgi:nicotinate-nucleotide pyrophosphorylase (carboxylating)